MSDPVFAVCQDAAALVERRRGLAQLVGDVRRRLRAGHVGNPHAYLELVEWIDASIDGRPQVAAGEIDWSFYGESFDTKLFELWCLGMLSEGLADALNATWHPPHLFERHRKPMFSWSTTAGDVALYFQRSLPSLGLGHSAAWVRKDDAHALRGTPDISVVVSPLTGPERVIIIDPKLRQRGGAPVEELYKILGYFNNFNLNQLGHGAIMFYTSSGDTRVVSFGSESGGLLLAASLDPERHDANTSSISALLSLILDPLGLSSLAEMGERETYSAPDESEESVARAQQVQVEMLHAVARSLGDAGIEPWMNHGEAVFGDSWSPLPADVKEMIATATYVGSVLQASRDFSGPILGLSAAAESLLWTHVLEPASASCARVGETKMLGAAISLIERALTVRRSAAESAVAAVVDAHPGMEAVLAPLVSPLQEMNREFRRPAAHRTLLSRSKWLSCHRYMLVGPEPLLPRLASALMLSTSVRARDGIGRML